MIYSSLKPNLGVLKNKKRRYIKIDESPTFHCEYETGDQFEIEFPLHPETVDPIKVSQLASAILQQMSNEFKICGEMSNGDVLQALSMVLAIRARMIHAPEDTIHEIASGLKLHSELLPTPIEIASYPVTLNSKAHSRSASRLSFA